MRSILFLAIYAKFFVFRLHKFVPWEVRFKIKTEKFSECAGIRKKIRGKKYKVPNQSPTLLSYIDFLWGSTYSDCSHEFLDEILHIEPVSYPVPLTEGGKWGLSLVWSTKLFCKSSCASRTSFLFSDWSIGINKKQLAKVLTPSHSWVAHLDKRNLVFWWLFQFSEKIPKFLFSYCSLAVLFYVKNDQKLKWLWLSSNSPWPGKGNGQKRGRLTSSVKVSKNDGFCYCTSKGADFCM